MEQYYWETAAVQTSRSGTGWTVDVTACRLDADLSILDFVILFDDIPVTQLDFQKTTATLLTYTGASLPAATNVEVRRLTPTAPKSLVVYQQRFSSEDYNRSLERVARQIAEFRALGVGIGSSQVNVLPADYGPVWAGDVSNAASRSAIYAKVEDVIADAEAADAALSSALALKAPLASPALTGIPTAPTAATATSNTQVATTGFVQANRTASEALTATALATKADDAATTAALALKAPLASPALTGNPTVPTQALGNNSTRAASTEFVQEAKKSTQLAVATSYMMANSGAFAGPIVIALGESGGTITNVRGSGLGGTGYTVPVSGWYLVDVSGTLIGASGNPDSWLLGLRLLGQSDFLTRSQVNTATNAVNAYLASVTHFGFFTAGEVIQLTAATGGGANIRISRARFAVTLLTL